MAYTKTTWVNGTSPAINATNLNKIETGIDDAHNGSILFPVGTSLLPSITFTGDTDTGVYRPASNQIAIVNGGAETLRINSNGKTLIGTDTSFVTKRGSSSIGARLQVLAVDDSASVTIARFSADTESPRFFFAKSRNTTIGSHTSVNSGDVLGEISFGGSDGTAIVEGARISAIVDTTPGSNDMPGRLVFFTTADGTSSTTERMRITNAGLVGIGTSSPATTLHTHGTMRYTNRPSATGVTNIGVDGNGDIREATSSIRFKENIEDYTKGLIDIKNLRPVTFNYKNDNILCAGFIAEELDALGLNEFVIRDNENLPYSIPYGNIVVLLTNAIKELNARIEELEQKIGG